MGLPCCSRIYLPPDRARSIRFASSTLWGLPKTPPPTSTTVSQPSTTAPGWSFATARHLPRASFSTSRAGVSAQAYCAAYVTAQKYGVDVSGFSFDKVCQMQAFGQKDPKELRSFIQAVKSAAYSIGKQVDRNLGKSEQEFMTDEFAIPEEKTEKPAKSKKSPER